MLSKIILLAIIAFFASSAQAGLWIKRPFGSSSFHGGQSFLVTWMDNDGSTSGPIENFGESNVDLYLGGQDAASQHLVQRFGTVSNAKHHTHLRANIDPKAGPNSDMYFVKISSTEDPSLVAFSARFKINKMTGSAPEGISPSDLQSSASNSTSSIGAKTSDGKSSASSSNSTVPNEPPSAAAGGHARNATSSAIDGMNPSNATSSASGLTNSTSSAAGLNNATSSASSGLLPTNASSDASMNSSIASVPASPNQAVGIGATASSAAITPVASDNGQINAASSTPSVSSSSSESAGHMNTMQAPIVIGASLLVVALTTTLF